MYRLLIPTCCLVLLAACSGEVKRGKQLLEASLPIPDEIEYREVVSYPGAVVCGEFSGFVSHHEPKAGFRPFIVVGEQVINPPRPRQLEIYCSEDPGAALLAATGVGPFTADNKALAKISADLWALHTALEAYYQANSRFPSARQGLQQLVEPSKQGRPPRNFPSGGYLSAIPADPWGHPYHYEEEQWAGSKGKYRVFTLGSDNAAGGSGDAMDVGTELLPYLHHIAGLLKLNR